MRSSASAEPVEHGVRLAGAALRLQRQREPERALAQGHQPDAVARLQRRRQVLRRLLEVVPLVLHRAEEDVAPAPGVRQRQRPAEVQEGAPRPRRLVVAPRQEERDADAGQRRRRGGAGAAGGRRGERLELPQDGVHAVDGEGGRRRRPDDPTAGR